ncbi:MAG: DUF6572 domain-containing protein [Planctomycetaceae bacterium]
MLNDVGNSRSDESFPKPEWPPIQNLDSIDVVGRRRDGGVDLLIVASQPLDNAPETLDSIRNKISMYLTVIGLDEFQTELGHPPLDRISIVLSCDFPIHPTAMNVIEECKMLARLQGVRLEVKSK